MTAREALLHEIKDVPEPLLKEVLDFLKFLQARSGTNAIPTPPRRWHSLKGLLNSPTCGEDAQASVSRSRQESDEQRRR
jgi:hypothetical protein